MIEQVGWVQTRSGEVFVGFCRPLGVPRATAVLLVPPFGWEEMAAARNLRGWARALADDGYATLRYHPPGFGDSSGTSHEHDLQTWSGALVDLVERVRSAAQAERIAVIGLGMGAQVALRAVDAGAPVDDLVLWAASSRGRSLLREMRAFAALAVEPHEHSSVAPNPLSAMVNDDGSLWVHGYALSKRAQDQLQELDASTLDLSRVRRALVLGRGTLTPDAKLAVALSAAGADVTTGPGLGYDELTLEPRLSLPPVATQATVAAWLPSQRSHRVARPLATVAFHETRLELGEVDAVLTPAPDGVLTAVFIGSGSQRRSGPNRFWADAARAWAPLGVASLRLDLSGVGDAAGPDVFPHGPEGYHDPKYGEQVVAVLDAAAGLGLPARFLLVGLSSGAYWAGQVALADPRVEAAFLLNPGTLVPLPLLAAGTRRYLTNKETWVRFARDPYLRKEARTRAKQSLRMLGSRLTAPDERPPGTSQEMLAALEERGVRVTVAISPGEFSDEDVRIPESYTHVDVHRFTGPVGAHTLSPAVLRHQAVELMDERVREVLAAVRAGSPRVDQHG